MTSKLKNIQAVIFDMDGVIIDSEGLWSKAEKEVFSSVGVKLTERLCQQTASMTTAEVTKFWYDRYPWENRTLEEVENDVIQRVGQLISEEGAAIPHVDKVIERIKYFGFKIGLATNSPYSLIPIVLEKVGVNRYFDEISSSEFEDEGKPDPSVYLTTAKKLNLEPEKCIAIEDSHSGLLSAKRAGMKTVLISDEGYYSEKHKLANYSIKDFMQFDCDFLN